MQKLVASCHHDWREIGNLEVWYFMALTFQLILITFVKFLKVKTQRKCAVLLFYIMIDEISSHSHTHLLFCNKERMMIWECKHAE